MIQSKGIALLEKDNGREILKRVCRRYDIKLDLVEQLIEAELEQVGKRRKRGLGDRFDEVLGQFVEDGGE